MPEELKEVDDSGLVGAIFWPGVQPGPITFWITEMDHGGLGKPCGVLLWPESGSDSINLGIFPSTWSYS